MESSNQNQYRTLDDRTRQLISQRLKNRSKSYTHKQNIKKGVEAYYQSQKSPNTYTQEKSRE